MGVLTFTSSVPSGTSSASTVPSSTASTSMVALSVSISAITSPDFTASPTFTCHLARVPSSMVGESARSEEHTSELQSLMRISYAVFCLKKKTNIHSIMNSNNNKQTDINKH